MPNLPLPEADAATTATIKDWLARFAACVREVDYASAYPFWHDAIVIFGTFQELVRSRQAWTVNGARLAVASPWLVLLFMSFQSEVIHRYSSSGGVAVLVFGAVACVVAYRLMTRIGRLPTERRILS